MTDGKRPSLLAILAAPKGRAEEAPLDDMDEPGPDEHAEAERGAARAFLDAVKADDEAAVVDAFHDLCDLHGGYEGEGETDVDDMN